MFTGKPIFFSALLLTGVNLLLRLVGTSFQVYLSSRIGAEGIGLLQLVLSLGSMAMVAGMAGIRTSTMYLTAEELGAKKEKNLPHVLSGCALYSILCSGGVGALVYAFAPLLAENWIGNPDTVDSLRLYAVFLPVNCLCGVMVGYFTGAGKIRTLAAVEVAEQGFTMVCTISLLTLWAGHNPEKCCMAVVMGSALGACLTLLCLTVLRLLQRQRPGPTVPMGRRILNTAIPLALADDLRTGITTVENLMVPKRLALYKLEQSPLGAFGMVCGMVFPILMFPMAILFGLTELLVPELARCRAAGSHSRVSHLVQKSLRVTLLYGTMCSGILFLNSEDLCSSLYHNEEAGVYLKWFSLLAAMLYCDGVTDAMIKGLGQQKRSVYYNIFTNILDVIFLYLLLPVYGITGYFISFAVTHAINFFLSIRRLLKTTGERIPLSVPLLTLGAGCAAAFMASHVNVPLIRTGCFLVIFTCLLFLMKILSKNDILWIRGLIYKK
ncbi:MAG: polysaccharide biosynthesis C-terminal domain-containing protein [Oscillospiraceae bacterium]|nr:polysaccharide biosynthesis C-terminal domain-containing protein [Oscillospiraceae bacterium]